MRLMNQDFELVISIIIVAGSAALFAYWFRYTCLLLLTAKTPWDHGRKVVASNGLSVLEVRSWLPEAKPAEFGILSASLDRDYAVLLYLLKHTPARPERESVVERRMLSVYYRALRLWYALSRWISDGLARSALTQMCLVISGFADICGARIAEV